MNLDKLVAVSGTMNGIFKMSANRSNGLILEDLDTGKRKFASIRRHQFTPLNSIGIYTDDGDSVEISKVFQNVFEQLEENPPIAIKSSKDELYEYFEKILPNYDRDQVYPRDIRRVIKWFTFLNERNLVDLTEDDNTTSEEE